MKKYLIPLILALVLGVNFFFFTFYFPGSTLDGADVSMQKRTDETTVAMDNKFTITAPSLNQEFTLLEDGFTRKLHLPNKSLFALKPLHLSSEETILYDEGKLGRELDEILQELPENRPTQDAKLLLKEGELILEPHKLGIDLPQKEVLLERVKEAIAREEYSLDLEPYIQEPTTFSKDLRPEMNLWRRYSLRNNDYSWVLEEKELLSLYKEDFTLDEKKAEELFRNYFSDADAGSTMWIVDIEESLPIFIEALKSRASNWEADYRRVRRDPDPGYSMYNGIGVSLERQWLWLYSDGEVIFQAPIVSGNPNRGYATHRGNWSILSKATNTRLANTNREGVSYDVPVNYWMQINNEGMIEGIHDATWHWAFGTDVYLWDGSHGCINLSVEDMATLYGLSWVGLPVWVY